MVKKNIFVVGLDPFGLRKLQGIRNAERYQFHTLLDYSEVVKIRLNHYPFEEMLKKSEEQLRNFPGKVDAIFSYWDFPADALVPILCRKFGLPSPSLEDILKCGHKYWARLEHQKIIPEYTPAFCAFDPFADDPLAQITLGFPFWVKPIKSFGSYLGFYVDSEATFHRDLAIIRDKLPKLGRAFNLALGHADLPPEVEGIGGNHCLAEEIIRGSRQNGPEGFVYHGEVHVNGITDTVMDATGKSFASYEYPSVWPQYMQDRSIEITKRLLSQVGLDNAPFNLEFIWNESNDDLKLIEVNPRVSRSLSDMFERVHGTPNVEVAVELALGERPDYPRPEGRFNCAGKFMLRHYENALVTRVPGHKEIEQVQNEFPGSEVYIEAIEGHPLSSLRDQSSYSYEVAIVLLGADNHQHLMEHYERCKEILKFEYAPVGEQA